MFRERAPNEILGGEVEPLVWDGEGQSSIKTEQEERTEDKKKDTDQAIYSPPTS